MSGNAIHQKAFNAIIVGDVNAARTPEVREHIRTCSRCKKLLKWASTSSGATALDYLHPTTEEIVLYVNPDRDVECWLTEDSRQVMATHFRKCAECTELYEAEVQLFDRERAKSKQQPGLTSKIQIVAQSLTLDAKVPLEISPQFSVDGEVYYVTLLEDVSRFAIDGFGIGDLLEGSARKICRFVTASLNPIVFELDMTGIEKLDTHTDPIQISLAASGRQDHPIKNESLIPLLRHDSKEGTLILLASIDGRLFIEIEGK